MVGTTAVVEALVASVWRGPLNKVLSMSNGVPDDNGTKPSELGARCEQRGGEGERARERVSKRGSVATKRGVGEMRTTMEEGKQDSNAQNAWVYVTSPKLGVVWHT